MRLEGRRRKTGRSGLDWRIRLFFRVAARGIALLLLVAMIGFAFAGCAHNKEQELRKAEATRTLGNAMIRQGEVRSGLIKLQDAARLDPENADIQHELALAYQLLGNYQEAVVHFKRAVELREHFPQAWNNLGTLYLLLKQWDEAIKCFEKAAGDQSYPTPAFAYNNMGLAYYNKGMYARALESYQMALKRMPNYSMCITNMGRTYEAMGAWDKAEEAYERSIEINPEYTAAHLHLAGIYLKKGKNKPAAELLRTVIEADPKGARAAEARRMLREVRH